MVAGREDLAETAARPKLIEMPPKHVWATFVYLEQGVKNPFGVFLVTTQIAEPNAPDAVSYRAGALIKARA